VAVAPDDVPAALVIIDLKHPHAISHRPSLTSQRSARKARLTSTPAMGGGAWEDRGMEIRRITRAEAVQAAAHLFDAAIGPEATARFLADERHHLLIAYIDGVPAGMVTGVEMTHPDKGTEMFVYELGVHEPFRGRGTGQALVGALAALARERGCYGMWVLTDAANLAAQAVYTRAGATPEQNQMMFSWAFTQ
jgi:GNAT superfamily N-acetyltransferase